MIGYQRPPGMKEEFVLTDRICIWIMIVLLAVGIGGMMVLTYGISKAIEEFHEVQ